MLFTDGMFVSLSDLNVIDQEVANLSAQNNIAMDKSQSSLLRESHLDAGEDLLSHLQNFSGYLVGVGVNSNALAAVLNILSTAINRPRLLLNQLTVLEPSPTRHAFSRWVKYRALFDFYRALYYRRTSEERFGLKMEMYEKETRKRWNTLKGRGIPVVLNPLSRPGATFDYGAGVWDASNVTVVSHSGPAGGSFKVAITYCSLPPYVNLANQAGAESCNSDPIPLDVSADTVISISLAGLNPPNGIMQVAIGTAEGVYPPLPATHWNVYIGIKDGDGSTVNPMFLQNPTPIPIATTTYTLTANPVVTGSNIGNPGQPAQYDFSYQAMLWRA